MKLLITGGAGYVGSHVISSLIKAGYSPIAFDSLETGFREAIPKNIDFFQGNILNLFDLEKVFSDRKIDAVLHFAAKLVSNESTEIPLQYYETNVVGTINLIKMCEKFGVKKFIFSSTAAVYGNTKFGALSEDDKKDPINPYGRSKLMAEQILMDSSSKLGISYLIFRYFNAAGASLDGSNGQRSKDATHLVKVAAETACGKRKFLEIFGNDYNTPDGTGVRDYVHIEDLANAHVKGLNYLQANKESLILNCGYGKGYSVLDVVKAMEKVTGKKIERVFSKRREGDAEVNFASNQKILQKINWNPQFNDLEVICKTTFDWESKI